MAAANSNTTMLITENVSKVEVGLGYGIATAVGILVLVSIIMLASYVCVRVQGIDNGRNNNNTAGNSSATTVLPSVSIVINCIEGGGGGGGEGLMDQAAIDSYSKIAFSRRARQKQKLAARGSQDTCCSICLAEYKLGENLRPLPDCGHCFHAACIDAWVRLNPSCPVCRTASPLPSLSVTPVPTPLSEFIPLARHSSQGH